MDQTIQPTQPIQPAPQTPQPSLPPRQPQPVQNQEDGSGASAHKKVFLFFAAVCVIIAVAAVTIGLVISKRNDNPVTPTPAPTVNKAADFTYIDTFDDEIKTSQTILTSYADYSALFSPNKLSEADFKNNNYAIVGFVFDSCSERNITPTDYTLDGKTINVTLEYESVCGLCAPQYMYYLLKLDKSITSAEINYSYKVVKSEGNCGSDVVDKPLIYLYPETETDVTVKLSHPEALTVTYPKYQNAWNVTAHPNGDLIDAAGRTYYGLYWEGKNSLGNEFEDGFVVSGADTSAFLEKKLAILGLTEREANEFIIYWLPKLEGNTYNFIRFETLDRINKQMPLEITPTPDTVIRVLMEYKPLSEKIEVKEQELTTPTRNGFTVVEWGGTRLSN